MNRFATAIGSRSLNLLAIKSLTKIPNNSNLKRSSMPISSKSKKKSRILLIQLWNKLRLKSSCKKKSMRIGLSANSTSRVTQHTISLAPLVELCSRSKSVLKSTSWVLSKWMLCDVLHLSKLKSLLRSPCSEKFRRPLKSGWMCRRTGWISFRSSPRVILRNRCPWSQKRSEMLILLGKRSWREPLSRRTVFNAARMIYFSAH